MSSHDRDIRDIIDDATKIFKTVRPQIRETPGFRASLRQSLLSSLSRTVSHPRKISWWSLLYAPGVSIGMACIMIVTIVLIYTGPLSRQASFPLIYTDPILSGSTFHHQDGVSHVSESVHEQRAHTLIMDSQNQRKASQEKLSSNTSSTVGDRFKNPPQQLSHDISREMPKSSLPDIQTPQAIPPDEGEMLLGQTPHEDTPMMLTVPPSARGMISNTSPSVVDSAMISSGASDFVLPKYPYRVSIYVKKGSQFTPVEIDTLTGSQIFSESRITLRNMARMREYIISQIGSRNVVEYLGIQYISYEDSQDTFLLIPTLTFLLDTGDTLSVPIIDGYEIVEF